jgi:hypothetical protein
MSQFIPEKVSNPKKPNGLKGISRNKIHYKIIRLLVALNGCKTQSLTLREQHRFRMFESRLPRRISAPTGDEVTRS